MKVGLIVIFFGLFSCATQRKQEKAIFVNETKRGVEDGIAQLEVKKYILPNGMKILLSKNLKLPAFSFYLHYGVGSKHEHAGITGSSHFLEHMMFKGAKTFGKGAFDRLIEGNGGVSNAYTSNDATVYHENLPAEALDLTIQMEADRMQNLLLDPPEFLAEKNVVLEERKMRYENSPRGQLYIRTLGVMYTGTPYGVPVIGSEEDIKKVSRDEVFDYFKTFYAPNNAVMVIVGDIDYDQTLKYIEKSFGHIPASQEAYAIKANKEKPELYVTKFKDDQVETIYGQSENPLFMIAFPAYPYGHKQGYALDVLAKLLGEGESSYFEQKYVRSYKPLLSNVSSFNYSLQHSGLFMLSGEFLKPISYGWWKQNVKDDLVKFCEEEITPQNLSKAINNAQMRYYEELDQNSGVADYIGSIELFLGDYRKYSEELKIYQSLTVADLKNECALLAKKPMYLLGIWKQFDKKIKL